MGLDHEPTLICSRKEDLAVPAGPATVKPCSSCGQDCWVGLDSLEGAMSQYESFTVLCNHCVVPLLIKGEVEEGYVGATGEKIPPKAWDELARWTIGEYGFK